MLSKQAIESLDEKSFIKLILSDRLSEVIEAGVDIYTYRSYGNHVFDPVSYILEDGTEKAVDAMLDNIPDINALLSGETLLETAAIELKDYSLTEKVLSKGADPNILFFRGNSLFFEVIASGNEEMIKLFLSYNADVNILVDDSKLINEVARLFPVNIFKLLAEAEGTILTDDVVRSACDNPDLGLLEYLHSIGQKHVPQSPDDESILFDYLIEGGDKLPVIKHLVEVLGVDPTVISTIHNLDCLGIAVEDTDEFPTECLRYLASKGCTLNGTSLEEETLKKYRDIISQKRSKRVYNKIKSF